MKQSFEHILTPRVFECKTLKKYKIKKKKKQYIFTKRKNNKKKVKLRSK